MKTCPKCQIAQQVENFHRHSGRSDGLQAYCKACTRGLSDWKNKSPLSRKKSRLATRNRKYGITTEWYEETLAKQQGACAICSLACTTGKSLAVDHNHETGKARGLLCMSCNTAIGKLGDDPNLVLKAYEYLLSEQK